MKTVKGKLFMAAAALGLAAASTIGSTYAWFTTQASANVNNVQMTVQGGEGLTIKLHGESSYGSKIDFENSPATYNAVTSEDGKNFFKLTDAKYNSDKSKYVYEKVTDASGFYRTFAVDVMFSHGYNIGITSYTASDTHGSNTTSALNALRVSAYSDEAGASIYRVNKVTTDSRTVDYAVQTFNTFFSAAITTAGKQGDSSGHTFTNSVQDMWKPNGVKELDKAEFITKNIEEDTDNPGFSKTTLTFNVWFEGNDYDCSNSIFDQKATFSFTLSTIAPSA